MANQIDEKVKEYPKHPSYSDQISEYDVWRNTLNGGQHYIDTYLEQYTVRESTEDFNYRAAMTVNPAFAEGAVTDIKNAIFQRFTEIRRVEGDDTYRIAIDGLKGGVDNFGRSMNSFIGDKVLIELIGMGKVGVYIDMPVLNGGTLADTKNASPYLYIYKREDILNWDYDAFGNLTYVILRKQKFVYENDIVTGEEFVEVKITPTQFIEGNTITPNKLNMIPFVILELNHGVLKDIAQYQKALMNISSSDINYLIQANFPLYTEQMNQNTQIEQFMKKDNTKNADGTKTSPAIKGKKIGVKHGRTYPIGAERPQYIHPSPEPLLASIKKQDQMKEELRQIVALSVSTMRAKMESAESKKADTEGLESGLAAVGTVLEAGERIIASIWQKYVGNKDEVKIFYPERYEIKDIDKTIKRCSELLKIISSIPVLSAQVKIMEQVVALLLSHKVDEQQLADIIVEVNKLKIIVIDQDILTEDMESGVISHALVAKLKHYPPSDLAKATKENLAKIEATASAQSKDDPKEEVRGVPATKDGKGVAVEDKKDKPQRGKQIKETQDA